MVWRNPLHSFTAYFPGNREFDSTYLVFNLQYNLHLFQVVDTLDVCLMASPCKNCGATKTEPVHRGLRSKLAKKLGYDLRLCARCRKYRLIDRYRRASPELPPGVSPGAVAPDLSPSAPPRVRDPEASNGCPKCGSTHFHRSRRGFFERVLLRRRAMARCSRCNFRFPVPV